MILNQAQQNGYKLVLDNTETPTGLENSLLLSCFQTPVWLRGKSKQSNNQKVSLMSNSQVGWARFFHVTKKRRPPNVVRKWWATLSRYAQ